MKFDNKYDNKSRIIWACTCLFAFVLMLFEVVQQYPTPLTDFEATLLFMGPLVIYFIGHLAFTNISMVNEYHSLCNKMYRVKK